MDYRGVHYDVTIRRYVGTHIYDLDRIQDTAREVDILRFDLAGAVPEGTATEQVHSKRHAQSNARRLIQAWADRPYLWPERPKR